MLKALTIFLGEEADDLIKEYLVSFNSYLSKGHTKYPRFSVREIFSTLISGIDDYTSSKKWFDILGQPRNSPAHNTYWYITEKHHHSKK